MWTMPLNLSPLLREVSVTSESLLIYHWDREQLNLSILTVDAPINVLGLIKYAHSKQGEWMTRHTWVHFLQSWYPILSFYSLFVLHLTFSALVSSNNFTSLLLSCRTEQMISLACRLHTFYFSLSHHLSMRHSITRQTHHRWINDNRLMSNVTDSIKGEKINRKSLKRSRIVTSYEWISVMLHQKVSLVSLHKWQSIGTRIDKLLTGWKNSPESKSTAITSHLSLFSFSCYFLLYFILHALYRLKCDTTFAREEKSLHLIDLASLSL